jgi:two-component system NtrC family response regulator
LFEVADGGTLFLDEIGELPKPMQAKLLRVLESGEIRRVGENEAVIVDVRVVCATHRRINEMVEAGDFREDLMFRINTFEIDLPSLRQRIDDIPLLAQHLVERFRRNTKPDVPSFTPLAIELLKMHRWPGNVRELANVIERATILCDNFPIDVEHLPERWDARKAPVLKAVSAHRYTLREIEVQAIQEAIDQCEGNKTKAAEQLGISLKTLYNRLSQSVSDLERNAG